MRVAEAADHAVGGAQALDLQHRALAGDVRAVDPLGDHAVERAAGLGEPSAGFRAPCACRATAAGPAASSSAREERLQRLAARGERLVQQRLRRRASSGSRTGSGSPASRPRACGCGSRPGAAASAARRRTACRRPGSRARRRCTKRSGASARSIADDLGEVARQRLAGFRPADRPRRPARKARQRKPSHFGSNCQPGSPGSSSTSFASIGAVPTGTGREARPASFLVFACCFIASSFGGEIRSMGPSFRTPVIPGRAEREPGTHKHDPCPMKPKWSCAIGSAGVYRFRARRSASPRNDGSALANIAPVLPRASWRARIAGPPP